MNHQGKNITLGQDVNIWHFTYIGDNTKIGDNTHIGSLAHIDRDVTIGKNCRIQGMVYLPPKTIIGNNVFIGPGVIFTNDRYPPSDKIEGITVKDNAIICAGAILKAGITVGREAVIGMGAIVTKDVPYEKVVYGTPARMKYSYHDYLEKRKTHLNQIE